ncbi:MAG: permease-like cell division protein FtsX [Clostridia bacterium]|nr:permease-like cell division protein FtsX [Clostridia bacterium]
MSRYNPFYFVGQALKSLWRNSVMTVASILILASCLIVLGSFALLVADINLNLDQLGLMNEIAIYLEPTLDDAQVEEIYDTLRTMDNVDSITYVSKEQGLEEMKADYADYSDLFVIAEGEENPLPDMFYITYEDIAKATTLEYQLGEIEGISKIIFRLDLAAQIDSFKSGVSLVFIWFLVLLFVVSLFVIINTIKIAVHARRNEINVMRYIGATRTFIITPFILEGVIIGLLSGAIAYFAEWYIYTYIEQVVQTKIRMLEVYPFSDLSAYVLLGFLLIGTVTGAVGSSISLRRNLNA